MFSRNVLAVGLVAGLASSGPPSRAVGDDKKAEGPTGTWVKKGIDVKLEFPEKEVLKVYLHGDGVAHCDLLLHAREGRAREGEDQGLRREGRDQGSKTALPVGLEFQFTWTVKDGAGKLDDVKVEKTEPIKNHLEGDYEKK